MQITNVLKGIAIIAVAGLHVLAVQHSQNYALNLFFRFSVPFFVALSGFGLTKSFDKKWPESKGLLRLKLLRLLSDYFVRRVLRLLPWYLFWGTIIYYYLYRQVPNWTLFISGQIDYHLYFVPMIFVLYLFFPLIWLLVKKFPWPILLATLVWQICWYWQIDHTSLSDQQQYILAQSWIFYFLLGIFTASQDHLLKKKWLKIGFALFGAIGLIWSVLQAQSSQRLGVDPIIFTRFTQIRVLVYATGFILSGLLIGPKLTTLLPNYLSAFLVSLGELSYLVYLNHVLILRILTRPPFAIQQFPFVVVLALVIIISYLTSLVFQRLVGVIVRVGKGLIGR